MKLTKILIIFMFLFTLTGCASKDKITYSDFEKLFNEEYSVMSVTDKVNSEDVISAYVALKNNNEYQIEFYLIENEIDTKVIYESNYNNVIKNKNDNSVIKEKEGYNYIKFTMYDLDNYYVISRVENTLIYVNASAQYKDEIEYLLKKIDY